MALTVRPARAADCAPLAANLRAEDLAEIDAIDGETALEAVTQSFLATPEPYVFEIDGQPAAMLGVVPHPDDPGLCLAWLLGTPALARHKVAFVKASMLSMTALTKPYRQAYNLVDKRYGGALRWLTLLGFRPVAEVEGRPPAKLPLVFMALEVAEKRGKILQIRASVGQSSLRRPRRESPQGHAPADV